jgi:sec-independent protein translocase protein TatB
MGVQPPIEIANIGMADTLILMVLALVVFGPRRLPQIGRQIGKLMYEFRKASNDFKFQMEEELRQSEEADRRKKEEEERQKALAASPPAPQLPAQIDQTASEAADSSAAAPEEPLETSPASEVSAASPVEPSAAGESIAGDAASGSATQEQTALPAAEETTPRIQPPPRIEPPSTGEIVAAERPGPKTEPPDSAEGLDANDNLSGANEAEQNETEKSEPAARHG